MDTAVADIAPETPPSRWPLALVAGWLVASIGLRLLVEGATAGALIGLAFADGLTLQDLASDPEALLPMMSATLMGAASLLQLVLLAGMTVAFAIWLGPDLRTSLALGRPRAAALAVAGFGGLTVGFFPGWVAKMLTENLPFLDWGNLEMLNEMLGSASLTGKLVMLVAIAVAAPLCEELIFRGFLWGALDRVAPTAVTWVATSALFALYHVDPVHVIAVFFTGLFLGWIRWTTGSVWPAIAAHFANNALAAIVVLGLPAAEETGEAGWAALLSVLSTFAFGAALWALRRRAEPIG